MSGVSPLPEDEAKLRAEKYVWELLESKRDDLKVVFNSLDEALSQLDDRFEKTRKDLQEQQAADRQALSERCVGKGQHEIDRLFSEQAVVHLRQAEKIWTTHAEVYEDIIRAVEQIGRDRLGGRDHDEEGRGR